MNFSLCKTETGTELQYKIFKSIDDVEKPSWEKISGKENIYLCYEYLLAIEKSTYKDISFRYLIFYKDSNPVAIAVLQSLKFIDNGEKKPDHICSTMDKFYDHFIKTLEVEVLNCGSPFACGENGFVFSEEISPEEAFEALGNALTELPDRDKTLKNNNIILIKEFWTKQEVKNNYLEEQKFRKFNIDVNMVMNIPNHWNSFDDYLQDLNTKFRTKAKSAFSKSQNLVVRQFDSNDIEFHKDRIEELYLAVLKKSAFKFGSLTGESFQLLKKHLDRNFIFDAYFLEDKMVGFKTSFLCNNILDANYIGIDYELNKEHAIYQKMLYDYVRLAIENNCKELRLGRTAEEIKSTIGAVPVDMELFIRHKNSLTNKLLKTVFTSIKPSVFEFRKPFKNQFYTDNREISIC